eukprot:Gb_11050 [translate_table: standard]
MKISLMPLLSVWLLWSLMIQQLCVAQDIQQQYLSPLNDARSAVGVGPLQWDDTVAAYAQNYANQRSGDCALMHSNVNTERTFLWEAEKTTLPLMLHSRSVIVNLPFVKLQFSKQI